MEFTLPKLNFEYNALAPYIDAKTMEIHHSRHHQAYVNNLNQSLKNTGASGKGIEDILTSISKYDAAVRNNGGGHYNHTFFWSLLTPGFDRTIPGAMETVINNSFGSVDAFKAEFAKVALARFGSGWVWLIRQNEKLLITSTPNQDNPLMDIAEVKGTPVLALDVWEHAYYLTYQNRRADYIDAFWHTLNWDVVFNYYQSKH